MRRGAAWRCKCDQARGDIDAVTQEIAVSGDRNIAKVSSDADLWLILRALIQELENGRDRLAGGCELHHNAVAGSVEDAPAVPQSGRIKPLAQGQHLLGRNGRIVFGPRRIARDINADN